MDPVRPRADERSTYVLVSNILVILLLWQWRPMPDPVWTIDDSFAAGIVWGLFGLGWVVLVVSTFIIDHHGEAYTDHRRQVSMLIPLPKGKSRPAATTEAS